MKRERIGAWLVCAALGVSLTGCGGTKSEEGATGLSVSAPAGTAVEVQAVAREDLSTDNKVSGRVAAEEEATIMVAVSAKCTAVYADAGDEVREGDILCTLDLGSTLSQYNAAQIGYDSAVQSFNDQKDLFDQQVEVAKEQVTVAERQIVVTEQQIEASERTLAASEQGLEASQRQLDASQGQIPVMEQQIATTRQQIELLGPQIDLAVKNYHDTQALLAIGAASQMEVDNAKIQADQAAFGRDQAQLQLSQLEAQLDQTKAQMEASQAQLDQSRAQLEASRAQIDQSKFSLSQLELQKTNAQVQVQQLLSTRNATLAQLEAGIESARANVQQLDSVLEDVDEDGNVIAPISGTLVSFNATENSYVSSAMPVAVIDGQEEMKLTASVSEALVPKLRAGDKADVYISALDRSMKATIRSVERAANVQTRLYTVTLSLDERPRGLYAGMFADVTFHTDRVTGAVVVPSEAVLTSGATEYVYVVEAGEARYVEIETGMTGTGVTEVLTGLRGGEALVTKGQSYLTDGDPVRVVTSD